MFRVTADTNIYISGLLYRGLLGSSWIWPESGDLNSRFRMTSWIDETAEDPDDNRILECAVENVSDFAISHDKDLLRRGSFEEIPIRKVGVFLERGFGIKVTQR